jgi:protein-S-isoprenylcysteine O-methyltransferase Ste14
MPVMTTPVRDMRLTIIERVSSPGGRVSRPWRTFAWLGAGLFGASLAYFLFSYAVTFGENQQTTTLETAVAWDLALFTVFALHHSVFARVGVRALVARTVPAAVERSVYVWIASLLLIAVCALWRPVGGVAWSIAAPLGWLMYGVLALGVWISVRSATVIDVWELAGVRQVQTPNAQPPNSQMEFKTTGPYGLVRHPIYLGWFLMVFGVPVMTGTRLVFAVVSCVYLLIAIPLEERTLRRTTIGGYDDYMRLVRWKLVPGIY